MSERRIHHLRTMIETARQHGEPIHAAREDYDLLLCGLEAATEIARLTHELEEARGRERTSEGAPMSDREWRERIAAIIEDALFAGWNGDAELVELIGEYTDRIAALPHRALAATPPEEASEPNPERPPKTHPDCVAGRCGEVECSGGPCFIDPHTWRRASDA